MDFDIDDFLPPAPPAAPSKPAGMSMRDYQLACIEQVEQGWRDGLRSQIAVLATGCHAAGTPILMADGHTKLVEDVVVGDRLMGWDNTPRAVLRLARGRQEMARIIPVKGEPFVVNLDHILTLVRELVGDAPYDVVSMMRRYFTRDIRVRDYIVMDSEMRRSLNLFDDNDDLHLFKAPVDGDWYSKPVDHYGFTVELLPEDDFYGFSIEGDGRFLLGDFTVTHNCGKTVIFSEIAKREVKAGHKVLILAHSDELIEQARDKFQRSSGLKAAKEKAQDYASRWDNVVVGSVQTLCRDARLKSWPPGHFDLIVVDEAHRSLAESYIKILNYFTARILGVTATADRGDKRALGEVYQRIAYEYGILQAVRDGWLVRPVVQTVPLELDLRGVHVANTGDGRDLDRREVSERIKPFLGTIATKIREFAANRKILCFTPSVETARDLALALRTVGFTADYVSGACTDRDEKVKAYKDGRIQCLVNMAILVEGFDHDEIDVVVCLRPTKIRSLYVQVVGRGTRPLNTIVGALNAAGSAAERRAIIAASAKPHLTLLDFLWLYEKHDLIRPASLVAKSKEEAEMMASMGDGDLLEQEERAERDLLAKLEAEVRKNARKAAKRIDPLTCVEELGDPALIDYEPQTQREAEAPTEPQLRFLSQQGIDVSKVTSKGLASALTGRIIQRHKSGLCTMRQLHFFSQLGIDAALFTRDEAHKLMSEKIAGWRTRSATVLTSRTDPAP